MIQKEELQLAPEDIQKLRKQVLPILLFPIAFGVIVYFMFNFVLSDTEGMGIDGVFTYVIIGFAVFFLAIIGYMVWTIATDLSRGIKYRMTGLITDKRLDINTSNRSSGSGRHGSRTKTTKSYYVYLDDEEFKMDFQDYSRVKVGDRVVMEKAPKSSFTLSIKTIETRDVETVKEEGQIAQRYVNTQIKEVRFNDKDRQALNRAYQADLKRKLLWMTPFVLIVISFITSDYWSLLVIMFPLVLVPLVQLLKLVKRVNAYTKDKAHDHKQGTTAIIEDKQTITSNSASGKNILKTTWGTISVSTLIYDKLQKGDKILIFKSKYDKKPMSLMDFDKQEFYLV